LPNRRACNRLDAVVHLMIPPKVIRFLEQHANVGLAGFRDHDLTPFGARVCGWRVAADGRTLTVLLPDLFADRVLDAMRNNGQMAVTVEEFPLHETYQLKGRYLTHRPIQPDEVEIANRMRETYATGIRAIVADEGPINQLRASIPDATLAIDIEVTDVFVQTPGPGAGARLSADGETPAS
jgi:hypothetical protein